MVLGLLEDVSCAIRREEGPAPGGQRQRQERLLRILSGLVVPSAGEYRYRDRLVTPATLRDRDFARRFRREVVLLFQHPDAMIFNPTVYRRNRVPAAPGWGWRAPTNG